MSASVRVEYLASDSEAEYAGYLLQSESPLLYASLPYRDLVAGHLSATPRYLVARDETGALAGVLPAMLSRPGRLGPVLNALPYYGSNGGPIIHSGRADVATALVEKFVACAEEHDAATATIIGSPFESAPDASVWDARFSLYDERIAQYTVLPDPGGDVRERLLGQFEDPRPRNIRRAVKAGVVVESSQTREALEFLYETHVANMRAMGGREKQWSFFESIPAFVPPEGYRIWTARLNGEPVAALLLFYFNRTVEYFTPATVESARSDQPLSALIFEAMLDAISRGFRVWNWGGTWLTQDGVYDFKRRWGTSEARYTYHTMVRSDAVLDQPARILLDDYPGFYVAPFGSLRAHQSET